MSSGSEAPTVLPGSSDEEKLASLCSLNYKQQTVWFMNGFFDEIEKDAEKLWNLVELHAKYDLENHGDGSGLDELNAHRILEELSETMTVREMRTQLRKTGAIGQSDRPKTVPITHYLLFKYGVKWNVLVNASQGDNSAEIAEAQRQLEAVQKAFVESEAKAKEAAAALAQAQSTEAEAKAREAEAIEAEAPFKAAQEEVEAALAEVKRQEDEYNGKIADAEKRSETGGVVSRNRAKNELHQLKAEDPLPLRKARITLEAANKRADKARAPFLAAREKAEQARAAAEQARAASEQAKQAADQALDAAQKALEEAEAYLEEVKSKAGSGGKGALWWIERELHEQKKFLPTSRGGIAK